MAGCTPERRGIAGALLAATCLSLAGPAEAEFAGCEAIWQTPSHGQFYEHNPTYQDDRVLPWPVSAPEAQGMEGDALAAGIERLAGRPGVQSVLVARHGVLVAERYGDGSDAAASNNLHSASKSMLGALVGIALAEGAIASLDDPVADYLPGKIDADDPRKVQITIRHLLTMSAGLAWEEDVTEYRIDGAADDWVSAILALPMEAAPGDAFNYSTGLTHVLSATIAAATGESTCDYAMARLLQPLGIAPEHWGRDPQGIYSGGYNLYMTPREMARFGQLYLQQGMWEGRQLVPAAWIAQSWQSAWDTGGSWDYGLLWWLTERRGHAVAVAWGWRGQLVYAIPDLDIVAVVTTDTSRDFPEVDAIDFIADTVIPSAR